MAKPENLLPPGLAINGELAVAGDLKITGDFTGALDVRDELRIISGARVTATIHSGSLNIESGAKVSSRICVKGGQSHRKPNAAFSLKAWTLGKT